MNLEIQGFLLVKNNIICSHKHPIQGDYITKEVFLKWPS